jgi:hypothetical protein
MNYKPSQLYLKDKEEESDERGIVSAEIVGQTLFCFILGREFNAEGRPFATFCIDNFL